LAETDATTVKAILDSAKGNFAAHDTTQPPGLHRLRWLLKVNGKKWQDQLDGGK
jgi:hypothetical protein